MHANPAQSIVVRYTVLVLTVAATWSGSALAQPLAFAGAESFAVLAADSVTNAGATSVAGDVGVGPGGTIGGTPLTLAAGSTLHTGDAVAAQALESAAAVYSYLTSLTCTPGNTDQPLGATLATGTHCYTGDLRVLAALSFTGTGPWIVRVNGALTVAPGIAITRTVVPPDTCGGSPVYWRVANAAVTPVAVGIGAGTAVVGNILAEGPITIGAGASLDGRALSLGNAAGTQAGSVSLDTNTIAACSFGKPLPTHTAFKVTGGGGINVPNDPAETDPDATGSGFANYGFNGQPGGAGAPATGHFNYVNHVIAPHLHINGPVTAVDIVALNPDGTPKTARLSGTCNGFLPTCTFSVLTEDNGEPAVNDRFGVTIVSAGEVVEARSLRPVRNGNIQFHSATLTTTINAPALRVGQTMRVAARLRKDKTRTAADAYLVLQLPGGQLLSWTGGGFAAGIVPIARNFVPVDLDLELLALQIPPGTPPGLYKWLSALTQAGTMNLLTGIAERPFTIAP